MQSKSIQYKCQNMSWKMMLSTVPYHGPNTIHLAHMSVLDYPAQVYGLSIEGAASRHLIIPVMVQSDWVYGLST